MSAARRNFRAESRKEWGINSDNDADVTHERLVLGCLQRIADSLESIASPFVKQAAYVKRLEDDNAEQTKNYWKRYREDGALMRLKNQQIKAARNTSRKLRAKLDALKGKQ